MNFIAHRGNLTGPGNKDENKFDYLNHALNSAWGIEVDVQSHNDMLYLGHDEPQEQVGPKIIRLLQKKNVFCHAKDIASVRPLLQMGAEVFFHTTEKFVFTSKGLMWCYPGVYPTDITRAIWTDFHWSPLNINQKLHCLAICGDDQDKYK